MESPTSLSSSWPGSMYAGPADIVDSTSAQPTKAPTVGKHALQDCQEQHSKDKLALPQMKSDPESTGLDDDSRNNPALQAYLMQLDLLDRQNKKRIKVSRQARAIPMADRGDPSTSQEDMPHGNHALQDYQLQLMLLEQQNKQRLMMARGSNPPAATGDQAQDISLDETQEESPALYDYQTQLLLLEEQNKQRLRLARAEQDLGRAELDGSSAPFPSEKPTPGHDSERYWPQLQELDRRYCHRKKHASHPEEQPENEPAGPDYVSALENLKVSLLHGASELQEMVESRTEPEEALAINPKREVDDLAASIISNVVRSPHDMNAFFDEGTKLRRTQFTGHESTLMQHDESAVDAALRRQHELQKLHQSPRFTAGSSPGFAPASFEYKGLPSVEIVEPPPRHIRNSGAFSEHMEYAPSSPPPQLAADNDRAMVDTFKNDNPAVVAQLKQIGSRRRSRRGQPSSMGPPRSTPISRIRGKAAVAAAASRRSPSIPGAVLPSPRPLHKAECHESVEVDRADICCPEGVSLAIRLRVNM